MYSFRADLKKAWTVLAVCALVTLAGALPAQNSGGTPGATRDADAPTSPTQPAPTGEGKVVLVIPVHKMIEKGLRIIFVRAMAQARKLNADAIVLDMHTEGGRVDSAIEIRDELLKSKVPTYTYVNNMAISAGAFIALSTDTIIMSPASNIGAALPITLSPAGPGEVERKFISFFKSEMRKTAKAKGHPADIAEGFCDPDVEIPGLKTKGDILTLDHDQATSVGLAKFISPSLEDLLEREGLGAARVERFKFTPTDQIARFLSNPMITGLLLMIGISGIFLEMKTPGFGAPGIIGLVALGLFFTGSYLANLSGYMEVIFFIIGVILLAVEIFVIPGFGVIGIAGIVLMVGSLFFALFNLAPEGFSSFNAARLQGPLVSMAIGVVGVIPVIWLAAKILPQTEFYGRLRLAPPVSKLSAEASSALAPGQSSLEPGAIGRAVTDLRPAGVAIFGARRADVVTEGDYVSAGATVRIEAVQGPRVVVRQTDDASPSPAPQND